MKPGLGGSPQLCGIKLLWLNLCIILWTMVIIRRGWGSCWYKNKLFFFLKKQTLVIKLLLLIYSIVIWHHEEVIWRGTQHWGAHSNQTLGQPYTSSSIFSSTKFFIKFLLNPKLFLVTTAYSFIIHLVCTLHDKFINSSH